MTSRDGVSRRTLAALVAALVLFAAACAASAALAQSATVRLVVDYGDGTTKTIADLPWSKGNTVLDVMNAAKTHAHGISFSHTGSGASAFLTGIDDVANQGGGSGRKNWQLWVNTAYADRSFAVLEVQASDVVFWRFATQQGN
jgi:hypothetical protein